MAQAEHNILTLDFWQDTVTYDGHTVPTGTLGCAALNLSDDVISELARLCAPLNLLIDMVAMVQVQADAVTAAGDSVFAILELLKKTSLSDFLDIDYYGDWFRRLFTEDNRVNLDEYIKATKLLGPIAAMDDRFKGGVGLLKVAQSFAPLGVMMQSYRRTFADFAEKLNSCKRTADSYATVFGKYFPADLKLSLEDPSWMALSNTSVQYISAAAPDKSELQLVKRMHYISFWGLLRSDLFEGLCVGHAPRKCAVCGKWFLTTDARRTKYCGGLAPGDKKGRTCRQVGNLRGRAQRELADDHPIKAIYTRRMNTITQYLHRGTIDEPLAEVMKRLGKDKLERAIADRTYAQTVYKQEMTQEALMAEAMNRMN